MVEWLNSMISLPSLIWIFLAAFMIHDFEEIIWVESWMNKNYNKLLHTVPKSFQKQIQSFHGIKSSHFAIPVFMEFILFIPAAWLAADHNQYVFFVGFNMVLLLHVFTHLGQSLYLRMYTPGVVTALVVTLPYSVYLFYRLIQSGAIDWGSLLLYLPAGLILGPIILWGHKWARKLLPDH